MKKKKIVLGVVATAVLSSMMTVAGFCMLLGLDEQRIVDGARFLGVLRYIESQYVGEVDSSKLIDGAIAGMVKSLGDPHSVYLDEKMYQKLMDQTDGSFGGIGVYMSFNDHRVNVVSVMEGGPGEGAGIQANDEIMAVDGTDVKEMQPEMVAMKIRGEVGSQVVLTIHREGEADRDYTITRDVIKTHTAAEEMLPDGIGYIRIASFGEKTGEEFKESYGRLEEQGMKGLIIDLRENPGGFVTSCLEIANMVVPKGEIVSVVQRDGSKEDHMSSLEESKYPIVVLIDGNSASASEILAGALQDTHAATLVGTKSYGKGSVQAVLPLQEGDALKLTIAKYFTPSGRSIDGIGIEPDVEIPLNPADRTDNQLQKAIEIMKEKI